MNTSKQVNAMIGLLGLLVLILGAYFVNEGNRQAEATDEIVERNVERGSNIFVNNCRGCHGVDGKGPEEGAIAPAINNPAFLILGEDNDFGVEATSAGVADGIRAFLRNTISCGRTGTFMPPWSQNFGGPLSDEQVNQVVILLTTPGAWEIEQELGAEHDAETGATRADILVADPSALSLTESNCGQYSALTALPFRTREDPRIAVATPAPGETATPTDGTPAGGGEPTVQGIPVADFFQASCAACHGADRAGITGLGLPLTPSALTQPDEFYFDTISNGRPGTVMPSWSANGLTDDEIHTLVTFLKTVEP
jgi:mono/diheme cytochrome c family protein